MVHKWRVFFMLVLIAIIPPVWIGYEVYGVMGWIGTYVFLILLALVAGAPRTLEDGTELPGLWYD